MLLKTWTFILVIIGLITNNLSLANQLIDNDPKNSEVKLLSAQRSAFLTAEKELSKSHNVTQHQLILAKHLDLLADYPLYPYLELLYLQQSIKHVNLDQMLNFVGRYPKTPLARSLRESWLLYHAKNNNWSDFIKGYDEFEFNNHVELSCYYIYSDYKLNHDINKYYEQVKKLWAHHDFQPKSCDLVFNVFRQHGLINKSMVWQRIKLAIMSGKLQLSKYLAKNYLDKPEIPLVELWLKVRTDPLLITKKNYFHLIQHPAINEILIYGINKLAEKDPTSAIKVWEELSNEHQFSNSNRNYVFRSIGLNLVKNSDPNALNWLKKISIEYKDQEVYNKQLVIVLKNNQWGNLIELYEELPTNMRSQDKWLYWYAMALANQKRRFDSKKILINLATKRSYYGFLASSKLLQPCSLKFKPISINSNQINTILRNPSLQRAYELLRLDRINKATQEWNHALKEMVEWELHAAAKLADSLNMPHWAIAALSDAKDQDDLSLRFPKYYSDHILTEAKKNSLDPAWVFAVTRQESAFRPYVKSYAGALGLMQIMPKTGFMVAKALNLSLRNSQDLLDVNKNVILGSKYLQLMLHKYNNLVLATAAYNAGPGRIQKWLPEKEDLSADLWIETIPFKDTRNYVQNVMTYMVIYQKLLGNNHHLDLPKIPKL